MLRPPIKKALEDKILRAAGEHILLAEIANLLIAFRNAPKKNAEVGYWQIELQFRAYLGDRLAVPPRPTPAWRAKVQRRYNELGLDEEQVALISKNMEGSGYRPPYSLSWLVWAADRLLVPPSKALPEPTRMHTGRLDD